MVDVVRVRVVRGLEIGRDLEGELSGGGVDVEVCGVRSAGDGEDEAAGVVVSVDVDGEALVL